MNKMSPVSKSKSKDKRSGKEPQKVVLKPSVPAAVGTGVSASAYNPLLGTFHTLESVVPNLSSPLNGTGRFRTMDEGDEQHSGSLGALVECDNASNNGSWSGDSEDQKERGSSLSGRQDSAPVIDTDKREKIRQKNEKKHQRQKEKRAQDLQERCRSYLMSRKLELLAQQLVGMGFSHERATMALILNEGRVEESIIWLLEGSEDNAGSYKERDRCNLKINISNELSQIVLMESKYSCSKQEVERAVVSCEGDLDKAADILRMQKQESSLNPRRVETEDTLNRNAASYIPARQQLRLGPSPSSVQRRDDKDSNHTKVSANPNGHWEAGIKSSQHARRFQSKMERATKPQQSMAHSEKQWASSAGGNSSISYSSAPPIPTAVSKREPLFVAVGGEIKPLPLGSAREPVTVMQRPQPANQKLSSTPPVGCGWHPANSQLDIIKSSGLSAQLPPPSIRNTTPRGIASGSLHSQLNYQPQMGPVITPVDSSGASRTMGFSHQQFMPSDGVVGDITETGQGNPSWQRTGAYPTLAAASSLGYFSGIGSSSPFGCTNPVNWTDGGNVLKLNYTDIDWSLETTSPRRESLMLGLSSMMRNKATMHDPGLLEGSSSMYGASGPFSARGSGLPFTGFRQEAPSSSSSSLEPPRSDAREWTSPFEGRDLFSLPRQFVTSPSL
ncbi:hypothetical protein MLD38_008159 [Melastoma candidum]|uniref:Uncharacterized protein n=1 Tax=Melastoma candidum TaxID=119954 RepID=A0ACB9RWH6_9MYRT|nr:hypothetical protein MLD38_008159 [Melastoma candidum]